MQVEHDSNFFRSSGAELQVAPGGANPALVAVPVVADTLTTGELAASLQEQYGRQIVSATALVGRAHFARNSDYDYTLEDLRAGLQSDFPHNIATSIGLLRTAQLARIEDTGYATRDVLSHSQADAELALPIASGTHWIVDGDISRDTNSADYFRILDLGTKELDSGVRFESGTDSKLDLLWRDAFGRYPNGSPAKFVSPGYRERGLETKLDWALTAASRVRGSIGYVERRDDDVYVAERVSTRVVPLVLISRNFSGASFDLGYVWQPSDKTRLDLSAARQLGAAGDFNYLSAATRTVRVAPRFQLTEKFALLAGADWMRRTYLDSYTVLAASNTTRQDTTWTERVQAEWKPLRWLSAKLELRHERRSSTIDVWKYTNNVANAEVAGNF